ncbi:CoA transferase [Endozoicomonas sp. GU-1]|uniref:CoA transferase n=1 Tax=Endozoicomonas sp. GU-1 TaxID=3009078 RepID=UPI0022B42BA8|nr:CoA transferase [Endozoicomonas sp. GU-1]WBA80867.1 CoA transferase [Endozoicomonas sp. GU-1]WBA88808.1 CoA transferase [Endozoicomonas sp. GU-1]
MKANLPLIGIRVIDFGQQIAGPAVAMILADLGATVIHIDPPTGPQWQSPANAVLNRNKTTVTIDLKSDQGLVQALTLIDHADIVLESFRPGVLKRLGIDFAQLRQARPELITISMPGYASNDQLRRQWKATEAIVAANSGAFTDMGFNRVLMGVDPSFSPLSLCSAYATTLAASSVVMALFAREKLGVGDHIEVPIVAALMEGLSYNSIVIEDLPKRYLTMREHEISHRKENNLPMDVSYDDLQEYLDPFYRTYQCKDGRFFYVVCPSHRNHAKRCLQVTGLYDELLAEGLPEVHNLHLPVDEWDDETSIGVYPLPKKWADIISAKMKQVFLTKTSEEWGVIFGEGQIPGAPHRTTQEWVNSDHCAQAGLIVEVDDPEYGMMKQPGPMVWLEESAEQMLQPRARVTVDFEAALAELSEVKATSRPTGAATDNRQAWLAGVKILDLTNVIAGPHSAAFLSRFGAEVIKLDPVTPLYDPLIGTVYSFQANIGKKSALVDINTEQGRDIFHQLVRSVDLVLINAPERQIVPLGLDEASLQAVNPGVLFCRLDCLGGPTRGPKTDYIGYDDIIQANSGIMSRFGGPQTPEEHAHLGTLDVNCGFVGGLGMALSLYHKMHTGRHSRACTSLSAATNLAQIKFAYDYQGRAPFDEASGREALGNHDLSHFYTTKDGNLFIDASEQELIKLERVPGLAGISEAKNKKAFLTEVLSRESADHWAQALREQDIAAVRSVGIAELRERYTRPADGKVGIDLGSYAFSSYRDHPSGHAVTIIDHYSIRPSRAQIIAQTPTERLGRSTTEIVAGLGYTDEQIATMLNDKVIGTGWGKEYLPS